MRFLYEAPIYKYFVCYIAGLVAGVLKNVTYGMQETRGVHELRNDIYAMQEAHGVHDWVRK